MSKLPTIPERVISLEDEIGFNVGRIDVPPEVRAENIGMCLALLCFYGQNEKAGRIQAGIYQLLGQKTHETETQ